MKIFLLLQLLLIMGFSSIVKADYVSHTFNKMDVTLSECKKIIKKSAQKIGYSNGLVQDFKGYSVVYGTNKNDISFQYVCVPDLKFGYLIVNGSDIDKEGVIISNFGNEIYKSFK